MIKCICVCVYMHLCFFQLLGDWEAQMRRVMKMIAGGGLSITGSHTMCGDYLYSGHTVMLTLTYLFIKECKSRRSNEKMSPYEMRDRKFRNKHFSKVCHEMESHRKLTAHI